MIFVLNSIAICYTVNYLEEPPLHAMCIDFYIHVLVFVNVVLGWNMFFQYVWLPWVVV